VKKYPEHERLSAIKDKSQVCGEFLEWLQGAGRYVIAEYIGSDRRGGKDLLVPASFRIETLLAAYFKISRAKLEREKREMLDELRKAHGSA
jgi:hypothetical protein